MKSLLMLSMLSRTMLLLTDGLKALEQFPIVFSSVFTLQERDLCIPCLSRSPAN
jgi:hypothetical protein